MIFSRNSGKDKGMTFLRVFLCFSMLGMFSSCDLKKEKNTTPKPPPAPKAKPIEIKPKPRKDAKQEVKEAEPAVVEWEGGEFSPRKPFKEADLILVLFYTDWCDHCRDMAPLLEGLTMREDQKIRLIRVNADLFPELAAQYRLNAVPKILLFNSKGKQMGEFVGAISEGKMDKIIKNITAMEN